MAQYYYYDGDKDMGFHGYTTLQGVILASMEYAKAYPKRFIGVYEKQRFGGYFLGRVYIGQKNGKKVFKYATDAGTFLLNKDGTIKG